MASVWISDSLSSKAASFFSNYTMESPHLHFVYSEGIVSMASLYTFLVLWATYCFCGIIYRRMTPNAL